MKVKLCDLNAAAADKLPGKADDKSGIGVHYVDAFLKPMNTKLEDGTAVKCKRRGLKIALSVGAKRAKGSCGGSRSVPTRSSCSVPHFKKPLRPRASP